MDLFEMKYGLEIGQSLFFQTDAWPKMESLAREKTSLIYKKNKKGKDFSIILEELPEIKPSVLNLTHEKVIIGKKTDITGAQDKKLVRSLKLLMPWRKGPFKIFGTVIDSEWNSALKWDRLKNHIKPLAGRKILDIGCSNGYYMFRMAALGPKLVFGIEPYPLFFTQHLLLQHFTRISQLFCLPLTLEEFSFCESFFDTVFCMGILYHQRSPLDILTQIHSQLRQGGELVLETLILKSDEEVALFPTKRYAKMNNVYFIPSILCLTHWLHRTGFGNIRCISIEKTTTFEQRKTKWIVSQSLESFMDPNNSNLTIEGYPAPVRAIVLATAK
jgi:tRNA (mo5U34)-methyltransferase